MVYAVIDTNILVSARISKNPLAATVRVVSNMFHNKIIPVYNEEIIAEYKEVLSRPKFKINKNQVNTIIDYIETFGIHTERLSYPNAMPDEDDRAFYEVSLSKEDSLHIAPNLK